MKPIVFFCTGLSGSGKSYFVRNFMPSGLFHNLTSATTRPMREGELDGREYYFRDEKFFEVAPLVTRIWANEAYWTPGRPKWLYGVPESEIRAHMGKNMVYDVIQPKYARQMIDWFRAQNLPYDFKVAYFIPSQNRKSIIESRTNMPNEQQVRQNNTCDPIDFLRADLNIDFIIKCGSDEVIIPSAYHAMIADILSHKK